MKLKKTLIFSALALASAGVITTAISCGSSDTTKTVTQAEFNTLTKEISGLAAGDALLKNSDSTAVASQVSESVMTKNFATWFSSLSKKITDVGASVVSVKPSEADDSKGTLKLTIVLSASDFDNQSVTVNTNGWKVISTDEAALNKFAANSLKAEVELTNQVNVLASEKEVTDIATFNSLTSLTYANDDAQGITLAFVSQTNNNDTGSKVVAFKLTKYELGTDSKATETVLATLDFSTTITGFQTTAKRTEIDATLDRVANSLPTTATVVEAYNTQLASAQVESFSATLLNTIVGNTTYTATKSGVVLSINGTPVADDAAGTLTVKISATLNAQVRSVEVVISGFEMKAA